MSRPGGADSYETSQTLHILLRDLKYVITSSQRGSVGWKEGISPRNNQKDKGEELESATAQMREADRS